MGPTQDVGAAHQVISDAHQRQAFKKEVERGEWINALECVSCNGVALPPLIICEGVDVQA
ncbi:hypothetical protein F4782DRAFT_491783 [Xylaria castorea]|nr:hypothetical protein F4782DRAFT_491783 [Xylaria castorea]